MVECFEIGKTQNIVKFTMNKYISKHIIVTLLIVRFLYDDDIDMCSISYTCKIIIVLYAPVLNVILMVIYGQYNTF